ncbi:hypothetical protein IWW55_006204 [Coemansia sp. RSA 2706]|nr:hypothetical protein LPJ70_000802 [Coemansia sp. RSA 2708]KAJ2289859.1 hypothetical protein IWW55_006204 [Coemansia sp. RSA 2706]KAJ2362498.1 hypothetical protein H4S02_011369 [Coemansia sp. RSA 2611]
MLPRFVFGSRPSWSYWCAAAATHSAAAVGPTGLMARRLLTDASHPSMSSGEQHLHDKLQRELQPTNLKVADVSGGCGSMYVVEVEAECFRGLSRVKQTKLVNSLLKDEIKDMHGMRVLCSVPPENR